MKFLFITVTLFSMIIGPAAQAEKLVWYSRSETGTVLFADLDSIRRDGDIVFVWNYMDASKDKSFAWRTAKHRYRFDCYHETFDVAAYVNYSATGKVLGSNSWSYWENNPVIPGSVTELLFKIVCD